MTCKLRVIIHTLWASCLVLESEREREREREMARDGERGVWTQVAAGEPFELATHNLHLGTHNMSRPVGAHILSHTGRPTGYLAHKKQRPLGPYSRTMPRALWWP